MAGILFHINDLAVVLERAYEVRIKICFRLHSRHCKKLVLSGRNAEEVKLPLLISQSRSVQIAFLAMLGGRDQHDFDALRSRSEDDRSELQTHSERVVGRLLKKKQGKEKYPRG